MSAVRLLTYQLLFIFLILFISPLSMSLPDEEALLNFKESLKNTEALDSTWKKGTSPCENNKHWVGVQCSKAGKVQGLRIMDLGLSGEIDVDYLDTLDELRTILISNNTFSGPMPPFNKLGALKSLFIYDNHFSGEIPSDFFAHMRSLKKVWLSGNKFSGRIPESLGKIPTLVELRLDHNEFSGPIPPLAQPSLDEINLSNNKLEGEIPETMTRFGAKPFEGNPGLCGPAVQKNCAAPPQMSSNNSSNESKEGSSTKWIILGIVVAVLLTTIFFKTRRKEDNFNFMGKENLDEVVQVHVPSTNKRNSSSRRGGNDSFHSSRRGSQHGKSVGDLVMVNDEKGVFGLPDLMKAAAEVLGNGSMGSAYKAIMSNGVSVVVKRLREMNKLSKDAFEAEIRRFGKLRHRNILPPLAYHYRKDEKLLVSEYIPKGSLLYILHGDRGISHAELNWPNRLKVIQGIARGMGFLHSEFASSELPHGNLKSCNVLLSSNYEPLLTDYAFYPLISNTQTAQALFAYTSPEAILYQQISPKSDVYCLGILILEILTGKFPSQYLNNQKGGTDLVQWVRSAISEKRESQLIDPEIANAANSLGQMEKLIHIAAACTESNHETRIHMREAISRIEEIQEV